MEYARLRERFADVAFTTAVPFADDSSIDHDALAGNLRGLYDAGARLFVANGNTGEYYALSHAERTRIVETHVEALPADAVVVGGVGGSVPTATDLASAYAEAGADAIMVMHPDHTYLHARGLRRYYRRLCEATDLGVVLYKRGPEVSNEVVLDLAERPAVVAVKFAVNDVESFSAAIAAAPDSVAWVNGVAERFAVSYAIEGADGFTTGLGNFLPGASLSLFEAIEAEHWERARALRDLLRPIEHLRDGTGPDNGVAAANNVPVVKRGMDMAGFEGGSVRVPLIDLADRDRERLRELFDRVVERVDSVG